MKKIDFKKLLMQTAVGAIACDGHIDDKEKEALYKIEKESPYFFSDDLKSELDTFLERCILDVNAFNHNLFNSIIDSQLSIVEELTLLEISLRIIADDDKEEDDEKTFILRLRNSLKLSDDFITQRFGEIEYLNMSEFRNFKPLDNLEQETKYKK